MGNLPNNISFQKVLDSLNNESAMEELIEIIKVTNPVDEEMKGVKLFLEENNYEYKALKEFLSIKDDEFEAILAKAEAIKREKKHSWLKYAAILIPLLGIGYLISQNETSTNDLYSNYYEKEVGLPVLMGSTDNAHFSESMDAFKDNDFIMALDGFEELIKLDKSNDTLLYFIGCSQMELGQFEKAAEGFQLIKETSSFKDKANFRLSLVLIQLEEYQDAQHILIQVSKDEKSGYSQIANQILQDPKFKKRVNP